MDKDVKNKVAVVTGGAEGIGYHVTDYFLAEGVKTVILLDINEAKGKSATENLNAKYGNNKVFFMKCDVTKDLEEVSKKIFEDYKNIDILVNNAGICDEFNPRKTIAINAMGVIEWAMKFWEHMRKDKGGRGGTIINIGSIYSFAVDPYLVYYKSSKYAVMGLTRSLGHPENFKKFGVRVVVACPGFTHTSLTANPLCWKEHTDDFAQFIKEQPWQGPEDVGQAVVHMFKNAESGSAWKVTGKVCSEVMLVPEGDMFR